jgi:energy-coupling factor transport system ATP-binding protein
MEIVVNFNALGRTVVLVTHDMRLVAEHATRAIVLLDGERLFDGTPRQLFGQPGILGRTGLALPPVTRLASQASRSAREVCV